MSALTQTTAKNRSGCVGVSLAKRKRKLRNGEVVTRTWWTAQCGGRVVRFSIDSLGNREAYREAVRARAEWVRRQAPRELARKKAKKQRNFKTYRDRYPQKEATRNRKYRQENTGSVNKRRREIYPGKARARVLQYHREHRPQINASRRATNQKGNQPK